MYLFNPFGIFRKTHENRSTDDRTRVKKGGKFNRGNIFDTKRKNIARCENVKN